MFNLFLKRMIKPRHHVRQEVCSTRAPYRDGRKPTAVKVYTIHHESKYLLIQDVPAVGAAEELKKLFETLGEIEDHKILDDYLNDQFAEVHLFKYKKIQSARFAKRKLDDWSFYGGVLHVCYAPEFETVQETREKLQGRRNIVERKSRQYKSDSTYSESFSQPSSNQENSRENDQHQVSKNTCTDAMGNWPQQNFDMRALQSEDTVTEPSCVNKEDHDNRQLYVESESVLAQPHTESGQAHVQLMTVGHCDGSAEQYGRNAEQYGRNAEQYGRNAEQYGRDILQRQAYAEQVLLQAHSLRHYGESTSATKETITRRLDTYPRKDEDADQGTQAVTKFSEEQLSLPSPPKQTRFSNVSSKISQIYGRNKVSSKQATFPVDYDARVDQHSAEGRKIWKPENLKNDIEQTETHIISGVEQNEINSKTMQEKVEENLKNQNIVIKHFNKKRTAPKFIPRQTQIKMKLNSTTKRMSSEIESKTDNLKEEIRRNAFKLGNVQGPADLGPSSSNERLDSKEKSVIDSMLEIKKKLTKVKHST